jgi:hypothetical protein
LNLAVADHAWYPQAFTTQLEDDIRLDELARELASCYKPLSLLHLSATLQAIAEHQLSGMTPEE